MQRPTIAILGASGDAGVELTRLIALHPGVELAVAGSDRGAGESIASRSGVAHDLRYVAPDRALEHAVTCSAAEISHGYVPRLELRSFHP
jgi:N-acetyl-gamma-glutamylphosphate reductase